MSAVTTEDFHFVADYLRKRSAISIGPGKEYLVESRLAGVARDAGFGTVTELIKHLRAPLPDPAVTTQVVEAMTTNETSFFRDHHPFDLLRTELVPEAIARNGATRRLRIWSAAASTGQELYSIAMVLDAHFPELGAWDLHLYGTDLSSEVIARARQGSYSPLEVNRGVPAPMLVKYFERAGTQHRVVDRLRRICTFEQMNLAGSWPVLPQFDLVFCRNVLIYFDQAVRRQVLDRIRRVLVPGGALLLGTAETTVGIADGYNPVRYGASTVFKAG